MKCRHCNTELSREVIDLGSVVPANNFLVSQDEPEQRYPLRALVCENCWLMQTDIDSFRLDQDDLRYSQVLEFKRHELNLSLNLFCLHSIKQVNLKETNLVTLNSNKENVQ